VRECKLERSPWHVHLGFDRSYSNGNFNYLFTVITGQGDPTEGTVALNLDLPELRNGAEGAHVVTAQALLGARGFPTELDGEFGPNTEHQTRAMQTTYGAESVDGVWGPETWTIAITGEDRL
jgi:peptidoglycan hydrolase-like protein with peptidoglycan-binding domain